MTRRPAGRTPPGLGEVTHDFSLLPQYPLPLQSRCPPRHSDLFGQYNVFPGKPGHPSVQDRVSGPPHGAPWGTWSHGREPGRQSQGAHSSLSPRPGRPPAQFALGSGSGAPGESGALHCPAVGRSRRTPNFSNLRYSPDSLGRLRRFAS